MGIKTIETRSWATDYRGPLFIHASKSRAGKSMQQLLPSGSLIPDFDTLPFGAIIGEVYLADVVRCSEIRLEDALWEAQAQEEKAFGNYQGKFCWMLESAVILEDPIPATGRLGLWEF